MSDAGPTFECARCGATFDTGTSHTELVRRDFVDRPRPSKIERLCPDCWRAYVDDFLDRDFEAELAAYEAEREA
ncbi:hypothetical protein HSBGL_0479 [Halapricum desulfuricans]|uniref:Small CPxCG-related zinc finger protein n=1 Tax=Halapricum desulfuricans TaxID=2841257 RepID=A0A897NEQ8_9EURY|nr:hypothetical protein [Halapricum desulfuricans]QSG10914.1 hypothetical protein HSBGL_0479 [Halapricum desulfuricans]